MAKTQLPENWVELVGVAESLEQYSRDEIKRQEVRTICTCYSMNVEGVSGKQVSPPN